jgi:hypothetical protein
MPRGGRRPGAGAPPKNLNALKNGQFSAQLKRALTSSEHKDWDSFLARMKDDNFRARANVIAALSWIRSISCSRKNS